MHLSRTPALGLITFVVIVIMVIIAAMISGMGLRRTFGDERGFFEIAGLDPGEISLSIEAAG